MKRQIMSLVLTLCMLCTCFGMPAQADVLTEDLPEVVGPSYVVIDADAGEILFGKAYDEAYDPGVFAQMMTAVLVIEQGNLNDTVTAPEIPGEVNNGNKVYLRQGEKISLDKLLQAMVVYNANDAALAAAVHIGGSKEKFVDKMNTKAKELGMSHTTFISPFGAAEGQTSTAEDLAKLTAYAGKLPKYVELSSQASLDWNSDAWSKDGVKNVNEFSKYTEEGKGIKLADDKSGTYDLSAYLSKNGRNLVGVIMRESDTTNLYNEMKSLLNYGMDKTKVANIVQEGTPMSTLVFSGNQSVRVAAKETFAMTMPSSADSHITNNAVYNKIDLPVKSGDEIGSMKVYRDDQLVQEIPLVALDGAKKAINWWVVFASILAIIYLLSIAARFYQRILRPKRKPSRPRTQSKPMARERVLPATQARPAIAQRKPTERGKRSLEEQVKERKQSRVGRDIKPSRRP